MVSPSATFDQPGSVSGQSPDVVIIIVNWNGRDDTLACLQSVSSLEYTNFRVIVVDNGSQDDSAGAIRAAYPDVKLTETHENLGFAEGNNVAIRRALDSDYVLLLNNDTTVDPGLLGSMISSAESDPEAGVIGPVICYADRKDTVWCAGLQIGRGSSYGIPLQYTSSLLMYEGRPVREVPHQPFEVDAVVGCAMLMRTSVVREIGLLDASLFMIHEDFDWSLRAREAGYRCMTVPGAGVLHRVSSSIQVQEKERRGNPFSIYYWYRNWLMVVKKHFGRKAMVSIALMYTFHLFPRLIIQNIRQSEFSLTVCAAYLLAVTDACLGTLKSRFLR